MPTPLKTQQLITSKQAWCIPTKPISEIVERGYPGKRQLVARLVAHLRKQLKAGITYFSAQPVIWGHSSMQYLSILEEGKEEYTA